MRHTRRSFFLGAAGILAGGTLYGAGCGRARNTASPPASAPSTPKPKPASTGSPRVVSIRHRGVVQDGVANADIVTAMVTAGLTKLLGGNTACEALRVLFAPDDIVGIKVNCLAGPPLASHPEIAYAVARELVGIGIKAQNVIIYDRDSSELARAGYSLVTRGADVRCFGSDEVGYDAAPTVERSVGTCFSKIVSQTATALINIPVVKDHDVAGLSGALKNHFGSIHNPNKLHTDHCAPFIADLNCAPVLRNRQRLVIADGLFVCYDGGPGYKPDTCETECVLLFATDPVAADAVSLSMVEDLRLKAGLPTLAEEEREPVYIAQAADPTRALGFADMGRIESITIDMSQA